MKRYSERQILDLLAAAKDEIDWKTIDAMSAKEIEDAALKENEQVGLAHEWYVHAIPCTYNKSVSTPGDDQNTEG